MTAPSATIRQTSHEAPHGNSVPLNFRELERLYGYGRSIDFANPNDRQYLREKISEDIGWSELHLDHLLRIDPDLEDAANNCRFNEAQKLLAFHRLALGVLNQFER